MAAKNPYSDLVTLMQTQGTKYNPPYICVGQVTRPMPEIQIMLDDLQLDKDNLFIADTLLDHGRRAELLITTGYGETGPSSVDDHGSHDHSIKEVGFAEGDLRIKSCLQNGDHVALLPLENRQKYLVLSKVVSL